ncbi:CDGSH iron-sulfur domain-containing protein [Streptomyces meridianus]|uniref:CDGSH iron-sulfur domain-containing protein n=1 Tax=Streptomyces meridianus TaxID=2938945 RepID=UPI003556136E
MSERFMVAICTCRRSRNHPWCDTSHRRRSTGPGPGSRADPDAADGTGTDRNAGPSAGSSPSVE